MVLGIEKQLSKLTFWFQLNLVWLTIWFKDWAKDQVVRDALLAQITNPHNVKPK